MDELKIPTSCAECFNLKQFLEDGDNWEPSPFKKPTPGCAFEKKIVAEEAIKTLKEKYNVLIPVDMGSLKAQLMPEGKQCLAELPKRAIEIRQNIQFSQLLDIVKIQQQELNDFKKDISNKIKQQGAVMLQKSPVIDAPKKTVKKLETKEMQEPDIVIVEGGPKAHGGWKFCQRNVNEENVPKYLAKLANDKPELAGEIDRFMRGEKSDAIQTKVNNKGRMMIQYRELVSDVQP